MDEHTITSVSIIRHAVLEVLNIRLSSGAPLTFRYSRKKNWFLSDVLTKL